MSCLLFFTVILFFVTSSDASAYVFLFWFLPSARQYTLSTKSIAVNDNYLNENVIAFLGNKIKDVEFDPALCYSAPPLAPSSTTPQRLPFDYVLHHEIGPDYTWKMLVDMDHEWATRAGQSFSWPATYYILCVKRESTDVASFFQHNGVAETMAAEYRLPGTLHVGCFPLDKHRVRAPQVARFPTYCVSHFGTAVTTDGWGVRADDVPEVAQQGWPPAIAFTRINFARELEKVALMNEAFVSQSDASSFTQPQRQANRQRAQWVSMFEDEDYDVGHMMSAALFGSTTYGIATTFYLANTFPMLSHFNQHIFSVVERSVRHVISIYFQSEVFVMTGAIYEDSAVGTGDSDATSDSSSGSVPLLLRDNERQRSKRRKDEDVDEGSSAAELLDPTYNIHGFFTAVYVSEEHVLLSEFLPYNLHVKACLNGGAAPPIVTQANTKSASSSGSSAGSSSTQTFTHQRGKRKKDSDDDEDWEPEEEKKTVDNEEKRIYDAYRVCVQSDNDSTWQRFKASLLKQLSRSRAPATETKTEEREGKEAKSSSSAEQKKAPPRDVSLADVRGFLTEAGVSLQEPFQLEHFRASYPHYQRIRARVESSSSSRTETIRSVFERRGDMETFHMAWPFSPLAVPKTLPPSSVSVSSSSSCSSSASSLSCACSSSSSFRCVATPAVASTAASAYVAPTRNSDASAQLVALQFQALRMRALFGAYQRVADFLPAPAECGGNSNDKKRPQLRLYTREKYPPLTTAQYWQKEESVRCYARSEVWCATQLQASKASIPAFNVNTGGKNSNTA